MLAGHFSRIYCEQCKQETFFHGRACSSPGCGYEKPNAPDKVKASLWETAKSRKTRKAR